MTPSQLTKKHKDGDMAAVDWLDRLALRKAELVQEVDIPRLMVVV